MPKAMCGQGYGNYCSQLQGFQEETIGLVADIRQKRVPFI